MPPWRARAYHLTRSRVFLGKAVAVILTASAVLAAIVHFTRGHDNGHGRPTGRGSFKLTVHDGAGHLESLNTATPSALITWIRDTANQWARDEGVRAQGFDAIALRLAGLELHPLLAKHTTSVAQREAVAAYARFRFLPDGDARRSALHALAQSAQAPSPPHANEMLGDALVLSNRGEEALQAYLRDVAIPAASHARRRATELALAQRDADALGDLCRDERVLAETEPVILWFVAKQTGDRRVLFRALWQMQWSRWMQGAAVPLALLAAAVWYVILIHTASREAMRWWRYLAAVFAGTASVWLLKWWQGTLDYYRDPEEASSTMHELEDWIMRVGLPEEAAKLLLFAFFPPVLLHHRSSAKAALTAGCVGLGFALDENLLYFRDSGTQVAIGRLLTANFMHISLTGIIGWHLYELFRSRFHHATEFLPAFAAVVAAHGIYDFSAGGASSQWGFDIAGMVILFLCAKIYLPMLHDEEGPHPGGRPISRTSVFCLGTALLGGMLMMVMVWERGSLDGITLVLKEMVGLALVGLIYVREWREV